MNINFIDAKVSTTVIDSKYSTSMYMIILTIHTKVSLPNFLILRSLQE